MHTLCYRAVPKIYTTRLKGCAFGACPPPARRHRAIFASPIRDAGVNGITDKGIHTLEGLGHLEDSEHHFEQGAVLVPEQQEEVKRKEIPRKVKYCCHAYSPCVVTAVRSHRADGFHSAAVERVYGKAPFARATVAVLPCVFFLFRLSSISSFYYPPFPVLPVTSLATHTPPLRSRPHPRSPASSCPSTPCCRPAPFISSLFESAHASRAHSNRNCIALLEPTQLTPSQRADVAVTGAPRPRLHAHRCAAS
ncbi:hypothetical protein B0H11DRAFT_2301399 [Mycena galericulata]|nr:hypothetical protein B0H11DRAFT_2301399 [Mycena galericulata]